MMKVRDILDSKGHEIFSVTPVATVFETLELMAEHEIGAVLVIAGDNLVGIFSERNYARQVILKGKASKDTPVSEVMTIRVVYVRPEQTLDDCMALMTDKRVRHLPVMEGGQLRGLLSIGDVVKAMIRDKEFTIEQLENYIATG